MTLFIAVVNLLVILGLTAVVWKKQDQAARALFWPALGLRLLGGVGLGLVYQQYYGTGDTFYFFEQAKNLAGVFQSDAGEYFNLLWQDTDTEWKGAARSAFFVKVISLFVIGTGENYWVTSLWFSLLSFLGSLYLVNCITRSFQGSGRAAAIAFLFFPSVVFWGSGVIKECIGLAGFLFLSGIFLKVMTRKKPLVMEFIVALICFWIVWNLKYYWIAVFLPVAATSFVVKFTADRFRIPSRSELVYWVALFLVFCLGASLLHPNFYLERFLQVVIENHQAFVAISDKGDLIHYDSLNASWSSVLANAPWALVSGIFRPFPWEADSMLKVAASLENVLIFLLFITSIRKIGDLLRSPSRLITTSAIVYILLLCIFLALSTPNMGSLARYRVGFIPFLIFLILHKNPLIGYVTALPFFHKSKKGQVTDAENV